MDFNEFVKLLDGGTSITILLFVGWRLEAIFRQLSSNQQEIIKLLIDLCAGDDKP